MATTGRPPRPTAEKELEGYRQDRINQHEPRPSTDSVRPPEGLSSDALAVWVRYAPDMIAKGVLTDWDVPAFTILCTSVAQADALRTVLDEQGLMIKDGMGQPKVHPALGAHSKAVETFNKFASRFGMTPADRASLSIKPAEKADPDADFFS